MKSTSLLLIISLVPSFLALPLSAEPDIKKPRVEVCFVLDTTGSMSDLIEGAKQKIWSIANEIISAKPAPDLKLGLVGYRDRGDEYVVKSHELTDDIDSVYSKLQEFKAAGGGDTPESVNEALATAVRKMNWSTDRDVLKIIFLVGDAPPHMSYPDESRYPDLCAEAVQKDLIINTVQCGSISETTPFWQEIAKLSEGSYAAIEQSGNMQVVATPFDADLSRLNREIGETLVPYGDAEMRSEVRGKQAFAETVAAPAAADRLSYNVKTGKAVQGEGELLDSIASGGVKLEEIKTDSLPEDLQNLSKTELEKELADRQNKRKDIQKEIADLSKKREDFIKDEIKVQSETGAADSFDEKVSQTLRQQAEKKGIKYDR
jgi:Mg-chelatase subunit ChlD